MWWILVGLGTLLLAMFCSWLQARREIRLLVEAIAQQHGINLTSVCVQVSWGWPFYAAVGFDVQIPATENPKRVQQMMQQIGRQLDERYG